MADPGPYRLAFTKSAAKTLRQLAPDTVPLLRLKLEQVAADPFGPHPTVTKLQNRPGYRLRVGDWRILYEIQPDQVLILMLKIGLWGEVYR